MVLPDSGGVGGKLGARKNASQRGGLLYMIYILLWLLVILFLRKKTFFQRIFKLVLVEFLKVDRKKKDTLPQNKNKKKLYFEES